MQWQLLNSRHGAHHMRYKIAVALILLLAFAVRIYAALWWDQLATSEGRLFRFGDSDSYWHLAKDIAQGLPYQYGSENASIFRAPGYPLLLSTMAWIEPEKKAVWFARVLGCLLGTAVVALTMTATARFKNSNATLISGLCAALYPGAIGMSVTILSEQLFVPLMMLHLQLVNHWLNSNASVPQDHKTDLPKNHSTISSTATLACLSGAIAGIAILTRPSFLLFIPFFAVLSLLGNPKKSLIVNLTFTGLGIAVCMLPWWYRNYRITDRFVPTTLQVGASLYDGLHQGASGGSDEGMKFSEGFAIKLTQEESDTEREQESTFEYRLNQRLQSAAMEWSQQNPMEVAKLAASKFARTWNPWPPAAELSSFWVRLTESIGCFGVLVLSAIGMIAYRDRWKEMYIFLLPTIYFTLLHMVFVGSIRYRQPAIVALCVLAGLGAAALIKIGYLGKLRQT
jgi:4-amino-4-deoxy-L-arabinose transferase-like glycosyltransferase